MGNNNIGNNPFLTEATDEIAEINVPALDMPQSPKIIVNIKTNGSNTSQSNSITNMGIKNIETNIIDSIEYIILPNNIDCESPYIFKVIIASSSKVLSSAVEAKKIITQRRADNSSGSKTIPPIARPMQASAVIENINIEANTARCLRLIANSFLMTLINRQADNFTGYAHLISVISCHEN